MKTLQVLLCLVLLVVAYASNAKRASYGVAAEDDSAAVEKRWAYGKPVEKRQWYGADNSKAEKRQWYNVNDDEAKVQKRWAYGKPVEKRQWYNEAAEDDNSKVQKRWAYGKPVEKRAIHYITQF